MPQRAADSLRPAIQVKCGEGLKGAHTGPVDFVLRALAARKLLQQRISLRCYAAEKPVIHASRSGNDILKAQVWGQNGPSCRQRQ